MIMKKSFCFSLRKPELFKYNRINELTLFVYAAFFINPPAAGCSPCLVFAAGKPA